MKIEKYDKKSEYSFSLGAFPTFELVKNKSKQVEKVLIHSKLNLTDDIKKLLDFCKSKKIEVEENDKAINKIADKENCFIVGVFKKFYGNFEKGKNLVLVNPSDMGNMGTILRTSLGFNFKNIVVIKPCVDVFNPKVIRASMGAIFSLNIVEFNSIDEYLSASSNKKFFFMLKGKKILGSFKTPKDNYDLVFGNEATGLPDNLLNYDESVVIKHSNKIDSLNLPTSVGMAVYEFSKFI